MSDCTKQICGDCLPLYRYFINQEPILENSEQTVTIPCPTGYSCTLPEVQIVITPGRRRMRPDLPPIDPDVDPICDYLCESEQVRYPYDPYWKLAPQKRVKNAEQTAGCVDLGYSEGDGVVIVPAGTIIRTVQPGEFESVVQIEVDKKAKELAIAIFLVRVNLGLIVCGPQVETPCGLAIDVSEPLGSFTVDPVLGSTKDITTEPGRYTIDYIDGAVEINVYQPFPPYTPVVVYWTFEDFGHRANAPSGGFTNWQSGTLLLPDAAAVKAWVEANIDYRTSTHDDPRLTLRLESQNSMQVPPCYPPVPCTNPEMTGNLVALTFSVTRTKKLQEALPETMQINNFEGIKDRLIPSVANATPTGLDTWNGQILNWLSLSFDSLYIWTVGAGFGNFRGYQLNNVFSRVIYTASSVLTTPNGCGWLLAIEDDYGTIWVGVKAEGLTPYGTYVCTPEGQPGYWTEIHDQKTAVRAMLINPLPAHARSGNILTATFPGALPAFDSVSLAPGDRVLITANGAENGIYTVTNVGSDSTSWVLTRATDADSDPEVTPGIWCKVTEGLIYAGIAMQLTTFPGPIVLNTTSQQWQQILPKITIEGIP